MNRALLAAIAAAAVIAGGYSNTAEARCFRVGHHWSCGHHWLHYGYRSRCPSWAGYGSSYPYYGASSYDSSFMGPRPSSGGGP